MSRAPLHLLLALLSPAVLAQTPPLEAVGTYDAETAVATIRIQIGSSVDAVSDLLGVGFKLSYDPAVFSYRSWEAGSFMASGGAVLVGQDFLVTEQGAQSGILGFSISRSGSSGGAFGSGTVAIFRMDVVSRRPGRRTFSFSEILALNSSGSGINLNNLGGSIEITGVWPGDTNNDCTVSIVDVLPLGLLFDLTGPARPGDFDVSWSAREAPFPGWSPFANTHADATGDGKVDHNDLLPIGLNLDKTQPVLPGGCVPTQVAAKSAGTSLRFSKLALGQTLPVEIGTAGPVSGLLGVAFTLRIDDAQFRVRSVRPGPLMDNGDLLSLTHYSPDRQELGVAYSRKRGAAPVVGSGALSLIELENLTEGDASIELVSLTYSFEDGRTERSVTAAALASTVAVATTQDPALPHGLAVRGTAPNPSTGRTTLLVDLPSSGRYSLEVFDLLGRRVWGRDVEGAGGAGQSIEVALEQAPPGLYLYRLAGAVAGATTPVQGTLLIAR